MELSYYKAQEAQEIEDVHFVLLCGDKPCGRSEPSALTETWREFDVIPNG
jgi:hypothetical protein